LSNQRIGWCCIDRLGWQLLSKDVNGCSTTPYDFFFLVRNEEAEGSNPFSSTIFLTTSRVQRGNNHFVHERSGFGSSSCHAESLSAKAWLSVPMPAKVLHRVTRPLK